MLVQIHEHKLRQIQTCTHIVLLQKVYFHSKFTNGANLPKYTGIILYKYRIKLYDF